MNVEVPKQVIIDAIANERLELLRPGTWFQMFDEADALPGLVQKEDCARCAVGCVINRIVAAHTAPGTIFSLASRNTSGWPIAPDGDDEYDLEEGRVLERALETLKKGHKPMAALSYFFEGICQIRRDEHQSRGMDGSADPEGYTNAMIADARADTVDFVRKYFPEVVWIWVNGFEPADDIKKADQ